MQSNHFFITNRFGERLEVVKEYMSNTLNQPIVLMVVGIDHDYHESNNSFDEISKKLVEGGFITYRFGFAGSGKSEGDFSQMTITRQAQQLKDVLEYIQKDSTVDAAKIGVLTQSLGGATTIAALPLNVETIVFLSPAIDPGGSIKRLIIEKGQIYNPSGISLFPRNSGRITKIGTAFWKDIEKINLKQQFDMNVTQSSVVFYGGKDRVTSEQEIIEFFCSPHNPSKVVIYKAGDHGFIDVPKHLRENVLSEIVSWFNDKLHPSQL